jgi:hypothetical protein
LDLGFVFASDDGGTTIGVVMFIAEGLGFVVQLALWLNLITKYKAKETICLYWISQPTKQNNTTEHILTRRQQTKQHNRTYINKKTTDKRYPVKADSLFGFVLGY